MPPATEAQLQQALESFRSGNPERAEEICARVLKKAPHHPLANHLLGVIRLQRGDLQSARRLLRTAAELDPANLQALEDLGVAEWSAKEFDRAETAFKEAVRRGKRNASTFTWFGLALAAQGKHAEAATNFEEAVRADPKSAGFRLNLANSLKEQGRLSEAVEHYHAALSIEPQNAEALNNIGATLQRLGRLGEAVQYYGKALSVEPGHIAARYNLGTAFLDQGEFEKAAGCFRAVLKSVPQHVDALTELGIALQRLRRFDEAISCFNRALEIQPDHADALNNLGVSLHNQLDFAAAAVYLRRAVAIEPTREQYHVNLGNTLRALDDLEGAIASYRKALELNPAHLDAMNCLGVVYQHQDRLEDALAQFESVLTVDPGYLRALNNIGAVYHDQYKLDEAIACYRKVLAIDPGFTDAVMDLATASLYLGRFEEGWKYYESRFDTNPPKATRRVLPSPRATEPDLRPGQRIAVWAEQGLGDQIMYSSLIPELLETGCQPVFEVDSRVLATYRRSFPPAEFVPRQQPLAQALHEADANIAVGCLAGLFRRRGEDFQKQHRGFLVPEAKKVEAFRSKLAARGGGLSVAISWKSTHGSRGRLVQARKSAPMPALAPLMAVSGVQFVDVQYGDTEAERAALAEQTGHEIIRFEEVDHFNDVEGVLAIIAACDLVITTSNVTAHFAGAIGKPTWLLYPKARAPFFYWISGPDGRSLWYPSVEVVTSPDLTDWAQVFNHAAEKLTRAQSAATA